MRPEHWAGRARCRPGCRRNRNEVTAPKFPPPPRTAQNRSCVLVLAGRHRAAVRQHHVDRQQAVDREAVLAREVADSTAERQPADAGRRDDPARHRQPVRVRRAIDLAPCRAALHAHRAGGRVDLDAAHPRQVDHQPVVAHCRARRRCGRRPIETSEPSPRAKLTAATTSSTFAQRAISAGPAVDHARCRPCGPRRSHRPSGEISCPVESEANRLLAA